MKLTKSQILKRYKRSYEDFQSAVRVKAQASMNFELGQMNAYQEVLGMTPRQIKKALKIDE